MGYIQTGQANQGGRASKGTTLLWEGSIVLPFYAAGVVDPALAQEVLDALQQKLTP